MPCRETSFSGIELGLPRNRKKIRAQVSGVHLPRAVRLVRHGFPRTLQDVLLHSHRQHTPGSSGLPFHQVCYFLFMGDRLPLPSGGASLVSHANFFYLAGSDACSDERYWQGDVLLLNVTDMLLLGLSRPFRTFFPPRHHYQRWVRLVSARIGKTGRLSCPSRFV